MKTIFKKFSAIVLAAVMVLAMCTVCAFADSDVAGTSYPQPTDTETITVKEVEAGATVTAYHVVKAQYVDGVGFEKYVAVDGTNIKDPVEPTATEIQNIAANISNGTLITLESTPLTYNTDEKTYTASVTPGYWLVLVTGGNTSKIYNPMIAGVYYSVSGSDNTMVSDPIDASKKWSLLPGTAYEKSVDVTTTKTIVGGDGKTSDGTSINTGADAAKDDYVQFKIESTIPAYTSNYKNVTYTINDTLTGGLGVVINDTYKMTVTVGGQPVDAADNTYSYITGAVESEDDPSQSLTIDFASNYILTHPGQKVVVTYYAKLYDVDGLATNMDANKNTANITYTNDPTVKEDGTTNTTTTPDSTTYHYTFEIDGDLSGIIEIEGNKETTEITKTGTETWTDKAKHITEKQPLEGAEFTLTNDATGKVYTTTTTESGAMNFKGLDAGTYTLKETKAPSPYTVNKKEIKVVISATYNENGTLNTYEVTVDGVKTGSYTAVYNETNITELEKIILNKVDSETYDFKNTQISTLPSTGGMGTYIFTIVGIAVIAVAAGMVVVSRKKKNS